MKIEVEQSDAQKILDALLANSAYHEMRDKANANLHLAKEVRFSPLTTAPTSITVSHSP